MNSHKHARLTAKGRALLVSRMIELGKAARRLESASALGSNVLARFRAEGEAGLADRRLRPTPSPGKVRNRCAGSGRPELRGSGGNPKRSFGLSS